jgi:glycosyltransferase involved in cell wall biosynthesis
VRSYFAVISCRNSEETIKNALVSIKEQGIAPEYVFVIDDGSTDKTKTILDDMKKEWENLYVITNHDRGYDIGRVVKNWNAAIKMSRDSGLPKTDYHMISTDNSIYPKYYAEKIISYMAANPRSAIVSGNYSGYRSIMPLWAGKFIRNSFFEETSWKGYYPEQIGYQYAVIYEASRCGYSQRVLDDIKFEQIGRLVEANQFYEFGASMRTLGYHPVFVLARFLRYFITSRVTGSIYMLYFYLSYRPKSDGYERMYDKNLRRYVRFHQLRGFKDLFYRRLRLSPGIRYAFQFNGFHSLIYFVYYRKLRRHNTILLQGKTYHYFDTGRTWYNERAVEIPIAMEMVRRYEGTNILEIGNVLSNYYKFEHDILDKYEIAKGVINEDVVDFESDKRYDLIVSVSTLEHVGWDEKPHDNMKILRAIENLKTLTSPSGTIIVTIPLGYNYNLDKVLRDGIIQFSKRYHLMRTSKGNEWKEASWEDVQKSKYNPSQRIANALLIGIIQKKSYI